MAPLHFTHVCQLFQELETIENQAPPSLRQSKRDAIQHCVERWFSTHSERIFSADTRGDALFSVLLPYYRTDRVFNIGTEKLSKVLRRVLRLSSWKVKELEKVDVSGFSDLGVCLERVLKDTDAPARPGALTINDLDKMLVELASRSQFSDPIIKERPSQRSPDDILRPALLTLCSWELKWFVRLILKDYLTVTLNPEEMMSVYHFLLPDLFRFQNSFAAAVELLQTSFAGYPRKPDHQSQKQFRILAYKDLRPTVGTKVDQPRFQKAWSIKNCLELVKGRSWSVERKYDGEFCEIHIDLSKPDDWIRIFSKSGKDSTSDRLGIHKAINESLRIGKAGCGFKRHCVLLGELLIYSDKENGILDFHEIRKHVTRSGRLIGTALDEEPQKSWEHPMIVYFDILLLDDNVVMNMPYIERRRVLSTLVTKHIGLAMTAEKVNIDFRNSTSKRILLDHFSLSVHARHEGLILKPLDAPYISLDRGNGSYSIKLKKDYMQEMGGLRNTADLCVIGASYEANQGLVAKIRCIKWTTFFVGCLKTAFKVEKENMRPTFKIVAVIRQKFCIPRPVLKALNDIGQFTALPIGDVAEQNSPFDFVPLMSDPIKMQVLFQEPFVVEVLGSGFSKPPKEDFLMLRHPRMLKLFNDRSWRDCVSLNDLAALADESMLYPKEGGGDSLAEEVDWRIKQWKQKVAERMRNSRCTTSPSSTRTTSSGIPSGRGAMNELSKPPAFVKVDTAKKEVDTRALGSKPSKALAAKPLNDLNISLALKPKDPQPTAARGVSGGSREDDVANSAENAAERSSSEDVRYLANATTAQGAQSGQRMTVGAAATNANSSINSYLTACSSAEDSEARPKLQYLSAPKSPKANISHRVDKKRRKYYSQGLHPRKRLRAADPPEELFCDLRTFFQMSSPSVSTRDGSDEVFVDALQTSPNNGVNVPIVYSLQKTYNAGPAKCKYAKTPARLCPIAVLLFHLSSDVSANPWVHDLLSAHGALPTRDLDSFILRLPSTRRGVILVEPGRVRSSRNAVAAVFEGWRPRPGDGEAMVLCADWRILEDVARLEGRAGRAGEQDEVQWEEELLGIVARRIFAEIRLMAGEGGEDMFCVRYSGLGDLSVD